MAPTMRVQDAVNGKSGECFVIIDGRRYNFAQVLDIQVDYEKKKSTVPILGRMSEGNKSNGLAYSGNATFHFNTSIFREMVYKYETTGVDTYFDIQITNDDPTTSVGRQTVIAKDCNIDGGTLAKLDVSADYLEDEISFTIETFELPEKFNVLAEMN